MRFLTAGESHGPGLIGILEGLPAGIPVNTAEIDSALEKRQGGYGRGDRMKIEKDRAEILGGVIGGRTYRGPLCIMIRNRDDRRLADSAGEPHRIPRPGHADLAGSIKYGLKDLKIPAERASARISAVYVAIGAQARSILEVFGIRVLGYVWSLGTVAAACEESGFDGLRAAVEGSALRCPDRGAEEKMIRLIEESGEAGDTVGGILKVAAEGVPAGLGSFSQWDRRLDGRLAGALMSIPGIKGVETGAGFRLAELRGSEAHDSIRWEKGYRRDTNRAGGIEGGVSNGEPIIVTAAMKPIPTLRQGLPSVDTETKEHVRARYVRSDVCAVPAASVVAEAMVSLCLLEAFLDRFGGDTFDEVKESFERQILPA